MIEISTSILTVEKGKESETFFALEKSKTDYFHIDVMDGKFVEKDTYKNMLEYSNYIRRISNLPMDVHLMVENPSKYIEEFALLNTSYIAFNYEAVKDIDKMINEIKKYGLKVGIAINPETSEEVVFPYLSRIDEVLIDSLIYHL